MSDTKTTDFQKLLDIVATLRGDQGCPWDRKQTPVTMKPYLLEETHELAEAIDNDASGEIMEEIGDLFFQLTLIARMYQEEEEFSTEDCLQSIIAKMIRRHPHVFRGQDYGSPEELKANWQKIKEKEKKKSGSKSGTLDVPRSLPALNRAQRVIHRASRRDSSLHDRQSLIPSLNDRLSSLTDAIEKNDKENIAAGLGSLLMELMHVGRLFDIYCEDLLQKTTDEFIERRQKKK